MKTARWFDVMLLICLLAGGGSSSVVGGRAGHNVTLTCKYNSRSHGKLSACWGRGDIPLSGCSHQIISTDGLKVKEETRVSSRYQLLGRLEDGDVSLTVLNVTEEDAGVYGCRVEKHGWFNDQKHYISLNIEEDSKTTTCTTSTAETSAGQRTSDAAGLMTSTESLITSSSNSVGPEESSSVPVVLVCVLCGLVVLVTVGVLVVIGRKWSRLNKIPQQQQLGGSVQFSSTSSSVQLHSRASAVENVYQIDEDGDEYEYCP